MLFSPIPRLSVQSGQSTDKFPQYKGFDDVLITLSREIIDKNKNIHQMKSKSVLLSPALIKKKHVPARLSYSVLLHPQAGRLLVQLSG